MLLQTNDKTYRGVSFDPNTYEQINEAFTAKSPVKITKFRTAPNKFDTTKEDIVLNNRCLISPTKVQFKCCLPSTHPNSPTLKSLDEIKALEDKTHVSCVLYLTVKDLPVVTTNSLYNDGVVYKKEVLGNDEHKSSITVTVYDDNIQILKEDGVYQLNNIVFRKYNNGGQALHVGKDSQIIRDAEKDQLFHCQSITNPDFMQKSFAFPIRSVSVKKYFVCCACKKDVPSNDIVESGGLSSSLMCPECKMRSRKADFKVYYILKLIFDNAEVNVYRQQVKLYYQRKQQEVPTDEDRVTDDFLQDESTILLTNARNTCIGFINKK